VHDHHAFFRNLAAMHKSDIAQSISDKTDAGWLDVGWFLFSFRASREKNVSGRS